MNSRARICLSMAFSITLLGAIGCGNDGSKVTGTLLAAHQDGDLYDVDRKTGATTLTLEVYTDAAPTPTPPAAMAEESAALPVVVAIYELTDISSMAFDADLGILYAGVGGSARGARYTGQIFEIDTATGGAEPMYVNPMREVRAWPGMTLRPSDGFVFGHAKNANEIWLFDDLGVLQDSFSIDAATSGNALTFNAGGARLFSAGGGANDGDLGILREIDPANGDTLSTKELSYADEAPFTAAMPDFGVIATRLISLTVANDTNVTYGILHAGESNDRTRFLVKVNLRSAVITFVAVIDPDMDGLVYLPKGTI